MIFRTDQNKKYKSSNTTVHSCQYHIIFCTKYRRQVLENEIAKRFKELVLEKQKDYNYEVLEADINNGDYIIMFTDGYNESMNSQKDRYEIHNIICKL